MRTGREMRTGRGAERKGLTNMYMLYPIWNAVDLLRNNIHKYTISPADVED